ncbi:MAG: hypothetical protein JSW34_12925 [Candidatus Zixiibacteriota bacterium]|nr:MAG: hypothetical protein JSW34_12925 [candidate division Zixibacteria bacterium]
MSTEEFELAVREHLVNELARNFSTFAHKGYKGKRTGFRHSVDVSLEGKGGADGSLTLVECKFHDSPVPSDLVMAFAFRLEDIGANAGLYVSASGYQLGSFRVASSVGMSLLLCVRRNPEYSAALGPGNLALQVFMSGQARKGGVLQFARMVSDIQCCPIPDLNAFMLDQLGHGGK